MYIEVLHDPTGEIMACYCVDTLPVSDGSPLFVMDDAPGGWIQSRVNIDTVTAMEIECACRDRAVGGAGGEPRIERTDRAEYVMANFTVDLSAEHALPEGVSLAGGMKMRGLKRRNAGGGVDE